MVERGNDAESPSPLDLLFVADPIEELNAGHDSSVAVMEAAQRLGHHVFVTTASELFYREGDAWAPSRSIRITPAVLQLDHWVASSPWYRATEIAPRRLSDFGAIFMRTDPPVDGNYIRATYLLDLVDPRRTVMVNDPRGIRNANEKLFALRMPELGPETMISAAPAAILEQVAAWGKAVLKPTDAMAGRGVLVLDPADVNLASIIETATSRGTVHVVVQRWIEPEVPGDRRIIVLDGRPIGVVRRVATGDDFRCNMAAGAVTVADVVTDADRALCAALKPHLDENGIIFAGIDVIGGLLTEVNVTSPTGIREIDALSGTDLGGEIVAWIEARVAALLTTDN